jgi:hypothetical protein
LYIRTSTAGEVQDLENALLFDFREDRKIIPMISRYPTNSSNIQHMNFPQKSSHFQQIHPLKKSNAMQSMLNALITPEIPDMKDILK